MAQPAGERVVHPLDARPQREEDLQGERVARREEIVVAEADMVGWHHPAGTRLQVRLQEVRGG